jgi:hypothetical protein
MVRTSGAAKSKLNFLFKKDIVTLTKAFINLMNKNYIRTSPQLLHRLL